MIRITSKKDGFRRCNVAHSREAVEHLDDKFSAKELKILNSEPMLVVEELEGEPKKTGSASGGKQEVTQAEIIEAIGKLDPDNKELWTNGGPPQVAAIEEVLGKNISAADRNAAWEEINKAND